VAVTSSILVVDVGTSGVRSAIVSPDASVGRVHHEAVLPASPAPGLVEVDAARIADAVRATTAAALAGVGAVAGVGIANQRATTLVWDRSSGAPVGPALGWQDLRTVGTCLALQAQGFRFPPNASATKLAAILDEVDPARERAAEELCFGTIDTWVAWVLSRGALHVTDPTNAAVTALTDPSGSRWDARALEVLGIPESMLPSIRRAPSARPAPSRAPRPSAASPATNRRRWSGRVARGPGWPRPPSAPAACSTR
jgi:glycerol kinase